MINKTVHDSDKPVPVADRPIMTLWLSFQTNIVHYFFYFVQDPGCGSIVTFHFKSNFHKFCYNMPETSQILRKTIIMDVSSPLLRTGINLQPYSFNDIKTGKEGLRSLLKLLYSDKKN